MFVVAFFKRFSWGWAENAFVFAFVFAITTRVFLKA